MNILLECPEYFGIKIFLCFILRLVVLKNRDSSIKQLGTCWEIFKRYLEICLSLFLRSRNGSRFPRLAPLVPSVHCVLNRFIRLLWTTGTVDQGTFAHCYKAVCRSCVCYSAQVYLGAASIWTVLTGEQSFLLSLFEKEPICAIYV